MFAEDDFTLLTVAELKQLLVRSEISLRGLLERRDFVVAAVENSPALIAKNVDPFDFVADERRLRQFIEKNGFEHRFCVDQKSVVLRAKQVRVVIKSSAAATSGRTITRKHLKDVDAVLAAKNDHQVLGLAVGPDLTEDALKKAYRSQSLLLHPDKNPAQGANEAFSRLTQSFDLLKERLLIKRQTSKPSASYDPSDAYREAKRAAQKEREERERARAEQERLKRERDEQERLRRRKEREEQERIRKQREEQERIRKQREEQERLKREREEEERLRQYFEAQERQRKEQEREERLRRKEQQERQVAERRQREIEQEALRRALNSSAPSGTTAAYAPQFTFGSPSFPSSFESPFASSAPPSEFPFPFGQSSRTADAPPQPFVAPASLFASTGFAFHPSNKVTPTSGGIHSHARETPFIFGSSASSSSFAERVATEFTREHPSSTTTPATRHVFGSSQVFRFGVGEATDPASAAPRTTTSFGSQHPSGGPFTSEPRGPIPAFTFGASPSTTTSTSGPSPLFTFGASSATTQNPPPIFTFGAPSNTTSNQHPQDSTPVFTFGATSQSTPPSNVKDDRFGFNSTPSPPRPKASPAPVASTATSSSHPNLMFTFGTGGENGVQGFESAAFGRVPFNPFAFHHQRHPPAASDDFDDL